MSIENENSLLNTKVVYDLTKFTHLDYPNQLACIVWFSGCNMRCSYCYNAEIVYAKSGALTLNDVLEFLKKRVGLLDGVVLSGGEATTHHLVEFAQEVKKLGFKIKLDTNGTNPKQIVELIEKGLLDYIALDYKAPQDKFLHVTKSNQFEEFCKTLEYLLSSELNFEVRTTLHSDLLNERDINKIISDLLKRGYKKTYYIQDFLDTGESIGHLKSASYKFDKDLLLDSLDVVFR